MKRQRNKAGKATRSATSTKLEEEKDIKVFVHGIETTTTTMTTMTKKNKKNKRDEKAKEEEVDVERGNGGDLVVPTSTTAEMISTMKVWEECPWMNGGVDEQMSWGSFWLPNWDVEFVGNAYNLLYGDDVVWDDDIWDLKAITQVPNE